MRKKKEVSHIYRKRMEDYKKAAEEIKKIGDVKIQQINGYYDTGKKIVDEKKEELSQTYRKRIDEYKKAAEEIKKIGDDMVAHGKGKVFDVYTHTKEEYIDKPREFIADILQKKYETLKEKYPTVKKVDELYASGKKVADVQKEKAEEAYSKTCKYYEDQKETIKQVGQELLRQGQAYLNTNFSREENGNDAKKVESYSLKEMGYELFDFSKKEMANLTKKYLLFRSIR